MKKTSYPFANLFVRLSRILGVFVFVAGAVLTAVRVYVCVADAASQRYRPSPELTTRLARVADEEDRARRIISQILPSVVLPEAGDVFLAQAPTTTVGFERMAKNLQQAADRRTRLKNATIKGFEENVNRLREKLLAHAKAMSDSSTPAASPATTPPPSATPGEEDEHLFLTLGNDERRERRDDLSQIRTLLEKLEADSQQPDSKTMLKDALLQLAMLMRLLPSPQEFLPVSPELETAATSQAPRQTLRAERVAADLATMIGVARRHVLESWKLDRAIENATLAIAEQQIACEKAGELTAMVTIKGIVEASTIFVTSLIVAFLVLVLADFLQTHRA